MGRVNNIALSTVLLFVISFGSLISNSDTIVNSKRKVSFPFVEKYIKDGKEYMRPSFNPDPEMKLEYPLSWHIKHFSDKISLVLIFIIACSKPAFPKWLFTLWLCFFIIVCLDWRLFLEQWPWRYATDSAIMGIHAAWLFYKYPKYD